MNKLAILLLGSLLFLSCSSKEEVPIYDYYKNIPILRGWTNDEKPMNFIIEVVLVYREGNSELRTMINALKPVLIDTLRHYFATLKEADYSLDNQDKLKMDAVVALNEVILKSMTPKKADKIRALGSLEEQDLLLDMNIMQLQIFSLN